MQVAHSPRPMSWQPKTSPEVARHARGSEIALVDHHWTKLVICLCLKEAELLMLLTPSSVIFPGSCWERQSRITARATLQGSLRTSLPMTGTITTTWCRRPRYVLTSVCHSSHLTFQTSAWVIIFSKLMFKIIFSYLVVVGRVKSWKIIYGYAAKELF